MKLFRQMLNSLIAVSGPASRIDSPPASPALLTDAALKDILFTFGHTLMTDIKSSVAGMETKFDARLNAADSKLTCVFFRISESVLNVKQ